MIEREWIRNIAQADHNGQNWVFANPEDIASYCEKKKTNIVVDLKAEAEAVIQAYNLFSNRGIPLKLLDSPKGLAFLHGPCQLSMVLTPEDHIQTQLLVKHAFQVQKFDLHAYLPYFDPFGEMYWTSEGQQNLTYANIVKQALTELAEAYSRFRQR